MYADCLREGRRKGFKPRVPKIQIRDCADMNEHEKLRACSTFCEGFEDKVNLFHVTSLGDSC